jgi:RNA polymerase sigma-70 factor (ECF subfamily)
MQLAPDKREVLILSRFNFKKFEEIAAILGCPVGTAKVKAHRAIRELRKIYVSLMSEAAP